MDPNTPILHGRKPEPYDPFPRRIAQDERLSPEALGLLCHLYSLPHDWEIYITYLENRFGWGRVVRRRVMGECVSAGYLELVQPRGQGGVVTGSHYRMTDKLSLMMIAPTERQETDLSVSTEGQETDLSVAQKNGDSGQNNREVDSPTVGSDRLSVKTDGRLTDPHKETTFHKEPTFKKKNLHGEDGSFSGVNWGFLGRDLPMAPRIKQVAEKYGEDYEAMWAGEVGEEVTSAKLAVVYGSYQYIQFVAGVVITAEKSDVPGKRMAFLESVLKNMKPPARSGPGGKRRVPDWVTTQLNATGMLSETAMRVCVDELGVEESDFQSTGDEGELYYRPNETARAQLT